MDVLPLEICLLIFPKIHGKIFIFRPTQPRSLCKSRVYSQSPNRLRTFSLLIIVTSLSTIFTYSQLHNLYLSLENFRPDSLFHMDLVHNHQWSQLTNNQQSTTQHIIYFDNKSLFMGIVTNLFPRSRLYLNSWEINVSFCREIKDY